MVDMPPQGSTVVVGAQSNGAESEFEMTERPEGIVFPADVTTDVSGGIGPADRDEMAQRALRYPAGNSSAAGAVCNYVNTIVGAGIVGLPFAMAQVCCFFFVYPPSCSVACTLLNKMEQTNTEYTHKHRQHNKATVAREEQQQEQQRFKRARRWFLSTASLPLPFEQRRSTKPHPLQLLACT